MEEERLWHLFHHIKHAFSAVAFDGIARQMDKHEISSKYTPKRFHELFEAIINQEKESYIIELELQLKSIKEQKKRLKGKFERKQDRIENHTQEIYTENIALRQMLSGVQARVERNDFNTRRMQYGAIEKMNKIKEEFEKTTKPILELRRQVQALKKDSADLQSRVKKLTEGSYHKFEEAKEKFKNKLEKFQVNQISTPEIAQREKMLQLEQNKTKQMRDSILEILQYVENLPRQQSIEPEEPVRIDDFRSAVFRSRLNAAVRSVSLESTKTTCESYKAKDGRTETIIRHINGQITQKISEVREKYNKLITKQQRRMERLQRELERAQDLLEDMVGRNTVNDEGMMRQIKEAQELLERTKVETDAKMESLVSDLTSSNEL